MHVVCGQADGLTGDIKIEDIIFLHCIIDQFPAGFIHHQDFPLQTRKVSSVIVQEGECGVPRSHIVTSSRTDRIQNNY